MTRSQQSTHHRCFVRTSVRSSRVVRREIPFLRALHVEWLEERCVLANDFGDASAPYPTLIADDGAHHFADGPTLGYLRDAEADGQPSTTAEADDQFGQADDEDGVVFSLLQAGQLDASVTVSVHNAANSARLSAWIDFNGDGSWGGLDEQILHNVVAHEGDTQWTFDIPGHARIGTTYARFRLSSTGGLGVTSGAMDGEVEDYRVSIAPPSTGSGQFTIASAFTDPAMVTRGASAADVDGDGDMDIVGTRSNRIEWFERTADGSYTSHMVSTFDDRTQSLVVTDVDGDGDVDVVTASPSLGRISWYENDGHQVFVNHLISNEFEWPLRVAVADVDSDGDVDILSSAYLDDTIVWFENDGSEHFVAHVVSSNARGAASVAAADVDRDGDIDLLSASMDNRTIAWYENNGGESFQLHVLSSDLSEAFDVLAVDVDADGDMDVVSASLNSVAWHENDGSQFFTRYDIYRRWDIGLRHISAADVDGDGDPDILAASDHNGELTWLKNEGNGEFSAHLIGAASGGSFGMFPADLDGDGDIDIVGTTSDAIVLFEHADHAYNFSAASYSVQEHEAPHTTEVVTVVRSGRTDSPSRVDVLLASGTATIGEDVLPAQVTLDFAAHATIATVPLELLGDAELELDETFYLSLDGGTRGGVSGVDHPVASVTILNDDIGDYGDAPFPYRTTFAEAGAMHSTSGPLLGALRDAEVDGAHSAGADADGLDDDGVQFITPLVAGQDAQMIVIVGNADNGAKLDAWIDFNRDGSWGGPREQVFDNLPVYEGSNSLSFRTPISASHGETYARFRLSSAGGLGVGAPAADGEVEDYLITLRPPTVASGWFDEVASLEVTNVETIFAADIDGDGDTDIISASRISGTVDWHENIGDSAFVSHTIHDDFSGASSVYAADIDGDGDLDVLSSSYESNMVAWFEQLTPTDFVLHVISTELPTPEDLSAADLDADGDMDILVASFGNDKIGWLENRGGTFDLHILSANTDGAQSVTTADVDRDGDLDILSASRFDHRIAWYENNGDRIFYYRTISSNARRATGVAAADVDGDGDMDVLSSSYDDDKIAWYENDGRQVFTEHAITREANGAESVLALDVDGDGDTDVVSVSSLDDKVAVYLNNGEQDFTARVVTADIERPVSVFAADAFGDGDVDLLVASAWDDQIVWYEQANWVYDFVAPNFAVEEGNVTRTSDVVGLGRSGRLDVITSANVRITPDSAFVGEDYADGDIPITFDVGQSVAMVPIHIVGDERLERHESVELSLTGLTVVEFGRTYPTATLVIENDDQGDFGDAPAPYRTTFLDNGAAHASFGPTLGATRDSEPNGSPSFSADGDGSDEDGVTFGMLRVGAVAADVVVSVGNAPSGARLDAWIDFDGDGSWGGQSEHVFDNRPVVEGDNVLQFSVPAWLRSGSRYARFRLSTAGGLGANGLAADGEVEDYWIAILPPVAHPGFLSAPTTIGSAADWVFFMVNADLNDDGLIDIVVADLRGKRILWFENTGRNNAGQIGFLEHTIGTVEFLGKVFVVDFDGDGDRDILTFSNYGHWFENDGHQSFTEHTIDLGNIGYVDMDVVDLDDDGDWDLVSSGKQIAWHENDGHQAFTSHRIGTDRDGTSIVAVDFDRDGDIDLVSTSYGGRVSLYRNEGHGEFSTTFIASGDFNRLGAADLDSDGDMDIIGGRSPFAWYENTGVGTEFVEHTIDSERRNLNYIHVADLDGDGDVDIITTSPEFDILWYENIDGFFDARTVRGSSAITPLASGDLDNDGDIDFAGTFHGVPGVHWYENANWGFDFTAESFASMEGDLDDATPQVVSIVRSGSAATSASVDLVLSTGTAVGGLDFADNPMTVELAPGETIRTVPVVLFADDLHEPTETILLSLENTSAGGAVGYTTPTAVFYIEDVDPADFGDAPSPYPTTLAQDGARHRAAGPQLGSARNSEVDAVPSADGDAFDDGVAFSEMRVGQLRAAITVRVNNAPSGAKLDAWIDFNGDGSWGGLGEQIFDSTNVVAGDNALHFDIPSWAQAGLRHARFRLSTLGALSVRGVAQDGEVEDYRVEIHSGAMAAGFSGEANNIAEAVSVKSVFPVDLDTDGDMDLVAAHADRITWYENLGDAVFQQHAIGTNEQAAAVVAVDLDGDGDFDVVSGGQSRIYWHENEGNAVFTRHELDDEVTDVTSVTVADMDGDGDWDVLTASAFDGLNWHENMGLGAAGLEFVRHTLPRQPFPYKSIVVDLDSDGDMDVVSISQLEGGAFAWYENDGQQSFRKHSISYYRSRGNDVAAFDMDDDGHIDVIHTQYYGSIAWYEDDEDGHFQRTDIGVAGYTLQTIPMDIDGDGDADLLSAAFGNAIIWYINHGDGIFSLSEIDPRAEGLLGIATADIDGDGDLDIVSFGEETHGIQWYENREFVYDFTASIFSEIEGDTTHTTHVVELERSGRIADASSVDVVLRGQSATAGEDFTGDSVTVSFGPGQTIAAIPIELHGDSQLEFSETLHLSLMASSSRSMVGGVRATAILRIMGDDYGSADFGDAPAPYPTTTSEDGALHVAVGPQLGPNRSTEPEGQASQFADSDSGDDGISFSTLTVGSTLATVTVDVRNAPDGAHLDGWIDFNRDGNLNGAREHVFHGIRVAEGTNILHYSVPNWVTSGLVNSRFRISSEGHLAVSGGFHNGEVEDFQVPIYPPLATNRSFGAQRVIGELAVRPFEVSPVDLDRDGDIDLVTAFEYEDAVRWHENAGDGNFVVHSLEHPVQRLDSLFIDDINGDGSLDIVVASSSFNTIGWYRNDATQHFSYVTITDQVTLPTSLHVADLDGDGDADVLTTADGKFYWYENKEDGTIFVEHAIASHSGFATHVSAADIDADGDIDILAAGSLYATGDTILWLENNGNQEFNDRVIAPTKDPRAFIPIDMDGDHDIDILGVASESDSLAWYENDGRGMFTGHSLGIEYSSQLFPADLDGDADIDIARSDFITGRIQWHENIGNLQFAMHTVGQTAPYSYGLSVADIDQDGDLDVLGLSSRSFSGTLIWFPAGRLGDFDFDDDLDIADVDALVDAIASGETVASFDLDGDQQLTQSDLRLWIVELYGTAIGDANLDFQVDTEDFDLWASFTFQANGGWYGSDFNADGVTDVSDFNLWLTNRFTAVGPPLVERAGLVRTPHASLKNNGPVAPSQSISSQSQSFALWARNHAPMAESPMCTPNLDAEENEVQIVAELRAERLSANARLKRFAARILRPTSDKHRRKSGTVENEVLDAVFAKLDDASSLSAHPIVLFCELIAAPRMRILRI